VRGEGFPANEWEGKSRWRKGEKLGTFSPCGFLYSFVRNVTAGDEALSLAIQSMACGWHCDRTLAMHQALL